jgi:protein-S-isoprenylcysteine O-methyltransferase Ste14
MRALELKIPPPAVALLTGILVWLASRAAPSFAFEFPAHNIVAICLVAVGVTSAISGFAAFAQARTTINPTKPEKSTSLVTSGVYTITRNPMYLGLLLVLTGWALHLSNAVAFLFLPGFIVYINRFQIAPEEKALTSLFAREFVTYQSRVRRWV